MSKKDVSEEYGVPKKNVFTWLKNTEKTLPDLEKSSTNPKRKKMRSGKYGYVDKAIFQWFLVKRSHNVLTDGVLLKEKALDVLQQLDQPYSKHQTVGYVIGKFGLVIFIHLIHVYKSPV